MDINKKDLLQLIEHLKVELDEWFDEEIKLDDDYYWEIDENEIYQFAKDPNNFVMGQLTEDWSELLRLKNPDEVPIKYDLLRLSVILRYLSSRK